MGVFDLVGTTLSGWLSDRYDSRWLLFWYYGLRGLSLLYLPYSGFSLYGLSFFAMFYGLDWIATVPPTVRLTNQIFGAGTRPSSSAGYSPAISSAPRVAALGAGVVRTQSRRLPGRLHERRRLCLIAALLALRWAASASPSQPPQPLRRQRGPLPQRRSRLLRPRRGRFSTRAPFGKPATCTVERAGGLDAKRLP